MNTLTIFTTHMYNTYLFNKAEESSVQIEDSKVLVYKHPSFSGVYALNVLSSPKKMTEYVPYLCELARKLNSDCKLINLLLHDKDLKESYNQAKDWIIWDDPYLTENVCLITFKHTQGLIVDIIRNSKKFQSYCRRNGLDIHSYIKNLVENKRRFV